jgi:hypothetical protein
VKCLEAVLNRLLIKVHGADVIYLISLVQVQVCNLELSKPTKSYQNYAVVFSLQFMV